MPRLTLGWLVLAAVLLLSPSPGSVETARTADPFCLFCGGRALADALLNVAFFVPLGWSLARRRGRWTAVALGLGVSLTVEILQIWIPGRFPGLNDVLTNTAGTALGAWLVGREARIVPVVAFGAVLAVVAPAVLLAPAAPEGVYYGQWTARFENMEPYDGTVLEASVGGIDTPSRRSEHTAGLRRALVEGGPVDVRFVAGPAPPGLAPVFSIFDEKARRIFLLGADGADVVVERWTRATTFRLDSPELRWPGALRGVEAGDTVRVRLARRDDSLCLTVDRETRCDTVPGGGSGWTLLLSPGGSAPFRGAIGVFWMTLMGALVAFPIRSWRLGTGLVGVLAVVSLALSADLPYLRGSLPQTLALLVGAAAAFLIRPRLEVR